MNTNIIHQVILKDGKTEIASWQLDAGTRPTLGDRIEVPAAVLGEHPGYGGSATVWRIEIDPATGVFRIEAEAESKIADSRRPVITLNSSLVPEHLRQEVMEHLRSRVDSPVFEWEDSYDSKPVVRLHQIEGQLRTPLDTLQTDIHEILRNHSELAVI